ncbi:hypothetical protein LOTGIDRAFT_159095 [Lottia gigantea]|uniref:galactosylceramidase n=1 Tax=Lottia gigantea TaxID=225164 RepID=V4AMB6_LOTGI|nr:hypothetical protein LOTGIDRAFT_159095 [Lottia gigantea]ESO98297.1 hypothetical protein LOTGIDRAFT_159095 [Lottia gigantea]
MARLPNYLLVIWISSTVIHAQKHSSPLSIDNQVYQVDDSHGYGRQFDGIGGISGTATCKLLRNYHPELRSQILDYLFKPGFGASLDILKVEVGGDEETTVGTESSHMHNPWDENYQRGYEWWLMKEVKKINPNVKLYGLSWGYPGWLRDSNGTPWGFPNRTAKYTVNWVRGAKTVHNLDIDYIGLWNEKPWSVEYIKILRYQLDQAGFTGTEIVGPDGVWNIADDVLKDPSLAKSLSIIGAHFPGTKSTRSALKTNLTLWASADYSTYNDETGGGCLARIINQNYVNGYMTARFTVGSETHSAKWKLAKGADLTQWSHFRTIAWNMLTSYYFPLPFYYQGLMNAAEPWSGHYEVKSPIWIAAHTTQFTEVGWTYLRHSYGVGLLNSGGSYVSLTSPDRKELTIVIETMSRVHSICIRPGLPLYDVSPQNVTFHLNGSYANIKQLNVWKTKFGFYVQNSTIFQQSSPVMVDGQGMITLSMGVDEVVTLTTLTTGQKGLYPEPPASQPFPLPYTDDFERYNISGDAYNLAQQTGAFDVVEYQGNKVLQQMVLEEGVKGCGIDAQNTSLTIIGNYYWTDISIQVDFLVAGENTTDSVFLGARIDHGSCRLNIAMGVYFYINPKNDTWQFYVGFLRQRRYAHGKLTTSLPDDKFSTMKLVVVADLALGYLNGERIFLQRFNEEPILGFVGFGTYPYGLAMFDNVKIEAVPGGRKPGQS